MTDRIERPDEESGAAEREFDECESDHFGWDGYHLEDAVRFARMFRRQRDTLRQQLTEAQAELIGAQCGYCKKGDKPRRVDNHMNFGPPVVWTHNDERFLGDCAASRIHEHLHQQCAARLASSSESGT